MYYISCVYILVSKPQHINKSIIIFEPIQLHLYIIIRFISFIYSDLWLREKHYYTTSSSLGITKKKKKINLINNSMPILSCRIHRQVNLSSVSQLVHEVYIRYECRTNIDITVDVNDIVVKYRNKYISPRCVLDTVFKRIDKLKFTTFAALNNLIYWTLNSKSGKRVSCETLFS